MPSTIKNLTNKINKQIAKNLILRQQAEEAYTWKPGEIEEELKKLDAILKR